MSLNHINAPSIVYIIAFQACSILEISDLEIHVAGKLYIRTGLQSTSAEQQVQTSSHSAALLK